MVKAANNPNGSVFGMSKGFTFVELVIGLMIIAIVASIATPWRYFQRVVPTNEQFLQTMNNALSLAYTDALQTGRVHRLLFLIKESRIVVETETDEKTGVGEKKYMPVVLAYASSSFDIPRDILFRNFYINGKDEIAGGSTKTVWFFITPEGRSQEVTMNVIDDETGNQYGYVLNPFTVQLTAYDEFQRS